MNDENASYRRVLKYVVPVIGLALTFNIPKFLEAEILTSTIPGTNTSIPFWSNGSNPQLGPTDLRMHPDYTIFYNNWARIIVLGVIPTALLIFFNTKIYQDIRVRRSISQIKSLPQYT